MCRWLAYSGPPLPLGDLLMRPDHSLIDQSRHARQNVETTNGDGFGVGWYGENETPGVYRDTHPAWNDANFRHLAEHIRSGLFLSHVRAATGTPVQNTNCHPFAFQNWLFQHNGSLPEFSRLKRQLMFDVDPDPFHESRTQYHSRHIHALRDIDGTYEPLPRSAVIVLSEPLDELNEHWEAVPESSFLTVENGQVMISPFTPA